MKFQVGDKVILLHSNEEGEVIDIINSKMVMVNVEGTKFPVYVDQIDFPYFKWFTQKKVESPRPKKYIEDIKKEKDSPKPKLNNGIWLSFLPVFDKDVFDDDIVEKFRLYLVNQTNDAFNFIYRLRYMGDPEFELKNEIGPQGDFYLNDLPFEKLNDGPKFEFEFSLSRPDKSRSDYFETNFKPRARQIFRKIEELKLKQEASFSYQLFDEYPAKVKEEKIDIGKLAASGYKIYEAAAGNDGPPPPTVIDLHIEKLTDNWQKMNNLQKLELQLSSFEKYYDQTVLHRQPMMIVVHGVGSGKLRNEIHDILRMKKEVKSFVNQYHPAFGYGATEIYLQYD